MNIGRLLGIGLLVMLLAGCQWLSPEDEERELRLRRQNQP